MYQTINTAAAEKTKELNELLEKEYLELKDIRTLNSIAENAVRISQGESQRYFKALIIATRAILRKAGNK